MMQPRSWKPGAFFPNPAPRLRPLLLGFLLLVSALVRLAAVWRLPLPLGDGGLFYALGRAVLEHHLMLPARVVYNGTALPFAYPPLGIYSAALLAWLLRVPLLDVMHFLPAVVSALAVLPVYGLAGEIVGEEGGAAWLAALFFALYWSGYNWVIMGGGVTRAWGYLWALAALWAYFRHRRTPRMLWAGLAGLFGGLTALSHPGTAFWCAVMLTAAILAERQWPWRRRLETLALVGGVGAVVASPWLGLVAARGELAALWQAIHTGHAQWYANAGLTFPWGLKMLFPSGGDLWVDGFSLLGLWNFRYPQRKGLAAAVVLTFVAAPRAPARYASVWLALLAWMGFVLVAQALWQQRKALVTLLAVVGLLMGLGDALAASALAAASLSAEDLSGMTWLNEHAPAASVLVLPVQRWWGNNNAAEWLPALTRAHAACLVQGSEWTGTFAQRVAAANALENAMRAGAPTLWRWIRHAPCPVEIVWLPRAPDRPLLAASLRADPHFHLLYQDESNFFFRVEPHTP